MVAALNLAEQGYKVYLIEKSNELGGIARRIGHTLDGQDVQAYLGQLIQQVSEHPLIEVYTGSEVKEASGHVGNFTTKIAGSSNGDARELRHGVTIIASGGQEYKPAEYLYGEDPRVITMLGLEEEINNGGKKLADANSVVIIQCVGSREGDRGYCSRVCCSESIKCALGIKEMNPETNVYILYRDMRTYGFKEGYYRQAREKGVVFIRYHQDDKPEVQVITEDNYSVLQVSVTDPILGERFNIDTDILALGIATVPSAGNKKLSQLFKVPLNENGFFLEAHVKLRPVDFTTEGVFLCGLAHSPKLIDESIVQAKAAASRACAILSKDIIEAGGVVSFVNKSKCSGCGVCELVCPFKAIEIESEEMVAVVNEALCKGCGACVSSCIRGAIKMKGFSDAQILAMIDAT